MIPHSALQRAPHSFRRIIRLAGRECPQCRPRLQLRLRRGFHGSARALVVKPFLLADIGEGIRECEVIQWFVEPDARVEQFDKLCEVQSDKASVEITSRFDGVIKKLHYEAGDMAIVGKPLVDIDIQSEISAEDEALTIAPEKQDAEQTGGQEDKEEITTKLKPPLPTTLSAIRHEPRPSETPSSLPPPPTPSSQPPQASSPHPPTDRHQTLATPAVRHLAGTLKIPLSSIHGTGKDGRILKEDVQAHSQRPSSSPSAQTELHTLPLSPIQLSMYRSMTASLSIPSFLYTSTYDYTHLSALRSRLNAHLATLSPPGPKLTHLPFLIKAVSHALHQYPILNARLDHPPDGSAGEKPKLTYRPQHNIGIATTTPAGLLVPVIPAVQTLSIREISAHLTRLSSLAAAGQLSPTDLAGGTFTISNIGSIAGDVVAPIIVPGQLAILGVGRRKKVPVFGEKGELVAREVGTVSWSADHRVVDGATVARFSELVRGLVEGEGLLLSALR